LIYDNDMEQSKELKILLFLTYRITEDLHRIVDDVHYIERMIPQTKKVTSANWNDAKDLFIQQRLDRYNPLYTINEKVHFELKEIHKLFDYGWIDYDYADKQVVIDRYKEELFNLMQDSEDD